MLWFIKRELVRVDRVPGINKEEFLLLNQFTCKYKQKKMLFQLLPSTIYSGSQSMTDHLPTELCANILRFTDSESLLNAVLVNRSWMRVCKGDPVLRKRIRMQIQETLHLQEEILMNPSRTVNVSRSKPGKIFGKNVVKIVTKRKLPVGITTKNDGEPKVKKRKQMVSKSFKNIRL